MESCNGRREKCRGERCLEFGRDNNVMVNVFTITKCVMELVSQVGIFRGDRCIGNKPWGRCGDEEYPFMCLGYLERHVFILKRLEMERKIAKICVDLTKQQSCIQGWRCNGILNALMNPAISGYLAKRSAQQVLRNKSTAGRPRHTKCTTVLKKTNVNLKGFLALENASLTWKTGGRPLKAEHQFAVMMGAKCVKRGRPDTSWYLSGKKDCSQVGSDEISDANGEIDCKDRIRVKGFLKSDWVCLQERRWKSRTVPILWWRQKTAENAVMRKAADGCPGLTRCDNEAVHMCQCSMQQHSTQHCNYQK